MRRLGKSRWAVAVLAAVGVMVSAVADGAVVQQTPLVGYQPNGIVRDIIVVGNTAYLGGQFTSLTSANGNTTVTRNHAAAIDMTTGNVLPWNPNVNGTVYTIVPSGNNIYVGGSFTTVGGSTHKNIAQVNATNGAVISAFTNSSKPNGAVRDMVVVNGNLYVGGAFTTPRPYLAEVNATTNTFIPSWQPVVDAEVRALATNTAQTQIIEGGFQQCATGSGCDGRIGIGAVNTTDGAFVPFIYHGPPTFVPPPGFPYRPFQVIGFAQDGDTLFAEGTGNGGTALSLDGNTGALNWQAGFNGNVVGIGVTDSVVYVGGHYSTYCGPRPGNNFVCAGQPGSADRNKLSAFDETTGALQDVGAVRQHRARYRGGLGRQRPGRDRRRVHPRRGRQRPVLRALRRGGQRGDRLRPERDRQLGHPAGHRPGHGDRVRFEREQRQRGQLPLPDVDQRRYDLERAARTDRRS